MSNNSCGKSFPLNIFKLIYKVVPVSLTASLVFLFVNLMILHLLYYIQPFICIIDNNNNNIINNNNNNHNENENEKD